MRRGAALLALPLALWACAGATPRRPAEERLVQVAELEGPSSRAQAWRSYARARLAGPSNSTRGGSADPPPFEEEAQARELLARVWDELASERGDSDRYLDELVAISSEGFMREYTWECLHVLRRLVPSDLRTGAFRSWFARTLSGHEVETWSVATGDGREVVHRVGRPAHEPYVCDPSG